MFETKAAFGRIVALGAVAAIAVAALACKPKPPEPKGPSGLKKPTIAFKLPEKYNSPDGMCLAPDGTIYLSMPNCSLTDPDTGKPKFPAKIMKITTDDKLVEVTDLPPHPTLGINGPLGINLGSDGNLYVADNMAFDGDAKLDSRLLRVNMKDGKAESVDVVAEGFRMSNAVACHGDKVYVTETALVTEADLAAPADANAEKPPHKSGVYCFTMAELKAAAPIKVTGENDPHVIVKLLTQNREHPVGANGMSFDSKGAMYVCNFGDAEVYKVTFDAAGKASEPKLLAKGDGMVSTDGMFIDKDDDIYVADFLGNAVHKIDPKTGKVTIIAQNGQSDGADGSLDAPSEALKRGNKIYVSNIDLGYGPNKADDVHTMSLITLD